MYKRQLLDAALALSQRRAVGGVLDQIAAAASAVVDAEYAALAIYDEDGVQVFGTTTEIAGVPLGRIDAGGVVSAHFDELPLLDGDYTVSVKFTAVGGHIVYDWRQQAVAFKVMHPGAERGRVALPVLSLIHISEPTRPY